MQQPTKEASEIINTCLDEVDADLINDIRRAAVSRDALLAQLDVLEKVRERLNVRLNCSGK